MKNIDFRWSKRDGPLRAVHIKKKKKISSKKKVLLKISGTHNFLILKFEQIEQKVLLGLEKYKRPLF